MFSTAAFASWPLPSSRDISGPRPSWLSAFFAAMARAWASASLFYARLDEAQPCGEGERLGLGLPAAVRDLGDPPADLVDQGLLVVVRHRLDVTRAPGFVEPGLERAIEPQDRVPAGAWHGLNPVRLLAGRGLGAEEDVDRAVVVLEQSLRLAADAGIALLCLDH